MDTLATRGRGQCAPACVLLSTSMRGCSQAATAKDATAKAPTKNKPRAISSFITISL
ncbi:hypothetical protein EMIT0196P_60258 [Pseudomonas chlororaphis]